MIMRILISVFLALQIGIAVAQTSQEAQYAAYVKASKVMWQRSISLAEKEKGAESFEKAVAMYGLLSNTMATMDQETFDDNIDQTIDLLKEIIEKDTSHGEAKAVLSATYGLVMAYSPMKGMLYGSKSSSLVASAKEVAPDSPLVQKLYASSKLYTPEMFGGSLKEAVTSYEKSIELYEKGNLENNWLYIDALAGLAVAYQKTGRESDAKAVLEKALEIEPEHGWAKSILASLGK